MKTSYLENLRIDKMKSNQLKYRLDPHHNWMTRFEAGVTGLPREAHERKWVCMNRPRKLSA